MIKRTSIYSPTSMYTSEYYNQAKYCGKTGYFNGRYKAGYQCVNYAVSRSCEIAQKAVCYYSGISTKEEIEKPMFNRSGYGNAVEWLKDTLWEVGTEPKVGAIMVYGKSYGSGYGHVRVVEAINGNTITYSGANESNDMAFKTLEKPTISSNGFLGYIYNPYVKDFADWKEPEATDRDTAKNQIEVKVESLRIRSEANTSSEVMSFLKMGCFYDVEEVIKSDLTWYKLGDYAYCAGNSGEESYVIYYPKTDDEDIEELKNKFKALTAENKTLLEENKKNEQLIVETKKALEKAENSLLEANDKLAKINELSKEVNK